VTYRSQVLHQSRLSTSHPWGSELPWTLCECGIPHTLGYHLFKREVTDQTLYVIFEALDSEDMYQSCVATNKVVHCLCQVQFADWRKHTESITSKKNDIFRMRTNTWYFSIWDVFNWICCPGILCSQTKSMTLVYTNIFYNFSYD